MKVLRTIVLAIALTGCSDIAMNCPSDHVVTATLNGPNIATVAAQLAAVIGPILATGGVAARTAAAAPTTSTSDGTLHVKTLDIVGVQSYSCGNLAAGK